MLRIAKSTVKIDDRWKPYIVDLNREVDRSLVEAAAVVAQQAQNAPSPSGYNIAGIQAKTQPELAIRRGPRGTKEVWIVNRDFRAVWFEKGTYRNRIGKVKAATSQRRFQRAQSSGYRSRVATNQGVMPQRFMRRGLSAGRALLKSLLTRNMDNAHG